MGKCGAICSRGTFFDDEEKLENVENETIPGIFFYEESFGGFGTFFYDEKRCGGMC